MVVQHSHPVCGPAEGLSPAVLGAVSHPKWSRPSAQPSSGQPSSHPGLQLAGFVLWHPGSPLIQGKTKQSHGRAHLQCLVPPLKSYTCSKRAQGGLMSDLGFTGGKGFPLPSPLLFFLIPVLPALQVFCQWPCRPCWGAEVTRSGGGKGRGSDLGLSQKQNELNLLSCVLWGFGPGSE